MMTMTKSMSMSTTRLGVPGASTFVDVIRGRVADQPDQVAFTFLKDGGKEEAHLTIQELDERARAIGGYLQGLGLAGERAFLFHPPGLDYVCALFGCMYAGVVAVPAYPPRANRSLERLQAMADAADASICLSTSGVIANDLRGGEESARLRAMRWVATDALDLETAEGWREPVVGAGELALLQFTSGSTERPKGVMLSHGNLMSNSALIEQAFEHTRDSRGVVWLPPFHDMGLIGGILQPLYAGFTGVLFSPADFAKRPVRWLEAISRYKAVTSGGPNFAYDLCVRTTTPEQRAGLDLSSWSVAFTGAEPIHAATLDRFAEAFAPCGFRREAFYPCYGMAESTLIVTGGRKAAAPVLFSVRGGALERNRVEPASSDDLDARTVVGCGEPLASVGLVIVDLETKAPCTPGRVGEIWVSGPSVAQGYWDQPGQTRETFQARLAGEAGAPYMRTGDLGFLHGRELFVTGRLKELIIIRGRNHYPQDISRAVESCHPAIRQGNLAAFAVPGDSEEQLALVIEVQRGFRADGTAEVVAAVRRTVAESFGLDAHDVVLIRAHSLPKTSSGKIQHTACRAEFLAGELEVIGKWSRADEERREEEGEGEGEVNGAPTTLLEMQLVEICARILEVERVGIHDNFFELGGASVQVLQVVDAAAQIGLELTPEMFFEHQTIAELATACQAGGEPAEFRAAS
ncbi:MAG TPA: AMP-binding protein [Isosphaeraceae bacterium]|nr:AMP-binding protein [Isosphaeraceae bacterium]